MREVDFFLLPLFSVCMSCGTATHTNSVCCKKKFLSASESIVENLKHLQVGRWLDPAPGGQSGPRLHLNEAVLLQNVEPVEAEVKLPHVCLGTGVHHDSDPRIICNEK